MRRIIKCFLLFLLCVALLMPVVGCKTESNNISEAQIYTLEDFDFVKLRESTFYDVCSVFPLSTILVTSYGGMSEYPMSDGGYIRIKYYGKDLLVESIETVYE